MPLCHDRIRKLEYATRLGFSGAASRSAIARRLLESASSYPFTEIQQAEGTKADMRLVREERLGLPSICNVVMSCLPSE